MPTKSPHNASLIGRAGGGAAASCIGLFLAVGPLVGGLTTIGMMALATPSTPLSLFHPLWFVVVLSYVLGAGPAIVTGLVAAAVGWRGAIRQLAVVASAGAVASVLELLILLFITRSLGAAPAAAGVIAGAGAAAGVACTLLLRRLFGSRFKSPGTP